MSLPSLKKLPSTMPQPTGPQNGSGHLAGWADSLWELLCGACKCLGVMFPREKAGPYSMLLGSVADGLSNVPLLISQQLTSVTLW